MYDDMYLCFIYISHADLISYKTGIVAGVCTAIHLLVVSAKFWDSIPTRLELIIYIFVALVTWQSAALDSAYYTVFQKAESMI